MKTKFKCDICKYYDAYSSLCETCFENEHFEENKYRLHDLRKAPNDYPKTKEPIIIYFSNGVIGFGHTYRHSLAVICSTGKTANCSIIGWKYLKPFGEE